MDVTVADLVTYLLTRRQDDPVYLDNGSWGSGVTAHDKILSSGVFEQKDDTKFGGNTYLLINN